MRRAAIASIHRTAESGHYSDWVLRGVTKGAGAPRVEEVDEKKDPLEYIPRPTKVSSATVGSGG